MSEVKTYDLEEMGGSYQSYRDMVEQTEYEGDWVRIEDYKKLEKESSELKRKYENLVRNSAKDLERINKLLNDLDLADSIIEHLRLNNSEAEAEYVNMQKELSELRGVYRWRDVDNELPEASGKYLVLTSKMYPHMVDFIKPCYDFRERFNYVTHWMPLPKFKEQGE